MRDHVAVDPVRYVSRRQTGKGDTLLISGQRDSVAVGRALSI
jgi:hypothetical protein